MTARGILASLRMLGADVVERVTHGRHWWRRVPGARSWLGEMVRKAGGK